MQVGVGDQFGGQQLDRFEHFTPPVPFEYGPHGHTCDLCGAGVMREPKGVHPGVGRGYGDHGNSSRERRGLERLADGYGRAVALPGLVRFRLSGGACWRYGSTLASAGRYISHFR